MKFECGIINGKPYHTGDGEDPKLFSDLSQDDQAICINWVHENVYPRKTINTAHTSYGMKHYLQHDTGIYLTNNQFKHLMLVCGYKPRDERKLNWQYCVSEYSPCFRTKVV